jgi:hypothetical protein
LNLSCCLDCLFFIAEAIHLPPQEPKKKASIIDLTLSDSADEEEVQLKSNSTNKPDCSKQTLNSAAGIRLRSYHQWKIRVLQLLIDRLTNILLSTSDSITWFFDLIVSSVEILLHKQVWRREGKVKYSKCQGTHCSEKSKRIHRHLEIFI